MKKSLTILYLLAFALPLALAACSDSGSNPTNSRIHDAQLLWRAAGVSNYSIEQRNNCFCPYAGEFYELTVAGDSITRVMSLADSSVLPPEATGLFRSVDDLFTLLYSVDPDEVASMSVTFDPVFGFPKEMYVDPYAQAADDEYGYSLRNLRAHD